MRGGENESKLLAADNEEQQSDCESMKLLSKKKRDEKEFNFI